MTYPVPSEQGSYALIISIRHEKVLPVGRLGKIEFPPGVYVYCGSAMGKGGLNSRLNHHLKTEGRAAPRWHVDWLFPGFVVLGCCYTCGDERMECRWSQALSDQVNAKVPAPGFGASDCIAGCPAHLIFFPAGTSTKEILTLLQRVTENKVEIR